jgi:hypothetical protein
MIVRIDRDGILTRTIIIFRRLKHQTLRYPGGHQTLRRRKGIRLFDIREGIRP